MTQDAALGPATLMSRVGRPHEGWVNTPVTRASTYVFDTTRQWREVRAQREDRRLRSYGARGTDSTHALEDAVTSLEGGARAQLFPTGQAAIAVLMAGILKAGDHVLVTDAVYEPVRRFCSGQLARQGVDVEYYLPDGSDLEARIGPRTRLIYAETPGSLAFEMMDMPKVAALARRSDCLLAVDNTWGSGVLYRPLDHGADLSIIAATKYLGGHADVMMGAVVANARAWPVLQSSAIEFGQTVGADDAYLVLRGMRSLLPRLRAHAQGAAVVADWLTAHPAVARLHCLSRPDHPGHALWKRDCHGMNGLMTVEFHPGTPTAEIDRALDRMRLFGIGASWGGFESLAVPVDMTRARTVADWSGHGPMIRLHVGLEDPGDLIADLAQALASLG